MKYPKKDGSPRSLRSREQLIEAALTCFFRDGYHPVSVEDIAQAAKMSRMTFYRHFQSKADILVEIFDRGTEVAMPNLIEIRNRDFRDTADVRAWITGIFNPGEDRVPFLQVFAQATKIDPEFVDGAQRLISRLIALLGETIPAFAVPEDATSEPAQRRWLEGWLVLYEIFDQGNQAALGVGKASHPLMIDVLTTRFIDFVALYPTAYQEA